MKEERRREERGRREEGDGKRERRGMKKKRRKEKLEIGFFSSPASASTLFSLMYFSISLSARGR